MPIQAIVSLAAIAGAAAIALICDLLRVRNAQLRDRMQRLEAQRAGQSASRAPSAPQRASRRTDRVLPRRISTGAPEATERTPPVVDGGQARLSPALTTWLIDRAAARADAKALAESHGSASDAAQEQGFGLVRGSALDGVDLTIPAGMHTPASLAQLTESPQLFTGLVISIGMCPKDPGDPLDQILGHSVASFVAGLLCDAEFGCRVNEREFLLICPGVHGAAAQRRLSQVSERLWDHQLRALGKLPLMFSLGGMDVRRESLPGAIASAKQRMLQGRRAGRKAFLSRVPRREAV